MTSKRSEIITKTSVIQKNNRLRLSVPSSYAVSKQANSDEVYVGGAWRKIKVTGRKAAVLSHLLILAVGYYGEKQWFYQAKTPLHFS